MGGIVIMTNIGYLFIFNYLYYLAYVLVLHDFEFLPFINCYMFHYCFNELKYTRKTYIMISHFQSMICN